MRSQGTPRWKQQRRRPHTHTPISAKRATIDVATHHVVRERKLLSIPAGVVKREAFKPYGNP